MNRSFMSVAFLIVTAATLPLPARGGVVIADDLTVDNAHSFERSPGAGRRKNRLRRRAEVSTSPEFVSSLERIGFP